MTVTSAARTDASQTAGYVLMPVVLMLALVATVSYMLSFEGAMGAQSASRQLESTEARYIAEAGYSHAKWLLAQNTSCSGYGALPPTAVGPHSYSVNFVPGAGSPVTVTSTGVLATGATSVLRKTARLYETPTVIVLQPGAAGEDAWVWDGAHKDKNFGTSAVLQINSASAEQVSFLRFDLSSLPPGAQISLATLELYLEGGQALSNGVINAHRPTRIWPEGEEDDATPIAPGVTYNDYDGTNPWTNPGGDYDPVAVDTITIPSLAQGWHQWNLTPLAEGGAQSVLANEGVLLRAVGGTVDKIKFTSSDGNAAERPKLMITYSCECGMPCSTSGTSGSLLMVVVNPANLTVQEEVKKSLIESWNYSVSLIDVDDSLSAFDAAVAINDVVFITEDIAADDLGTKLVDAPIGVVTEEDNLSDEFGFSTSIAWENAVAVDINDNAHFITLPFSLGSLTIFSATESLAYLTGDLSPDLEQLASSNSGFGLVALEVGSTTYLPLADPTAGRRVQLPWGGNAFDVNNLTNDGLTIFQRALEWAATDPPAVEKFPIAHWMMDETTGVVAADAIGGHDGSVVGAVWTTGTIDGGLEFDGTNDQVSVPHAGELSLLEEMTFTAWVRPDDFGTSYRCILSKDGGGGGSNYYFGFWQDEFVFGFRAGGVFREVLTSGLGSLPDTWYHLAASFDNATNAVRLYVNGSLVQTGVLTQEPTAVSADLEIGRSIGGEYWNGTLDDVRIYDEVLLASDIADLAGGGGGGGGGGSSGYNEVHEPWSAGDDDTWEAFDLGAFGVPANAVVEVAVINTKTTAERWGGVRAFGSTLDRRLRLHEAEGGGTDVLIMHVQTDGLSRIEHYSDNASDVTFVLLGYWGTGTFTEAWEPFTAGANNSWQPHSLSAYGVAPGDVAEILMTNGDIGAESAAGVRTHLSTLSRVVDLHEPEGGGKDMVTMFVTALVDVGATIEVFAESDASTDFHLAGHWTEPPGVYSEAHVLFSAAGPALSGAWLDASLASAGVPADAVVQVMASNGENTAESLLGIREKGSSLDRLLNFQEAESGGDDLATMHVNSDENSVIQRYDEDVLDDHRFYVLGWWVITP